MKIKWLMYQNNHQISIVKLANVSGFSNRGIYHLTKLTVGLPNLQQLADLPELINLCTLGKPATDRKLKMGLLFQILN